MSPATKDGWTWICPGVGRTNLRWKTPFLPSLQTILHDLGIEVRVKKAPVAVLVIEHVDRKPTDN
jgi:uncharacterized protein (TIGR03435 family)